MRNISSSPSSSVFSKLLTVSVAVLLSLSLSVPIAAEAATSRSAKSAHNVTKKTAKAIHHKKRSNQVSRTGRSAPVAKRHVRANTVAYARQDSNADIFQLPGAQSSLLLHSRAAVVMNAETGELLYSKNADRTMPIASITKLMTSIVVLDAHLPMDELITIQDSDVDTLRHSSSRLPVGTTLTRGEAMLLALMASENRAAASLARTYPGGTQAAVNAMNRKARELGMTHTFFIDGTGLHSENTSSPGDLVQLVKTARSYPDIHQFSTTAEHTLLSQQGRSIEFRNTNGLVRGGNWAIEVSKTGFIKEAGRCLVMQARINAKPVVIVLMDSNASATRMGDANRIKQWIESAF